RESARGVAAAETVLQHGGSPLLALRAFAAATEGQLDDEALAALEVGLRSALVAADRVTAALAWVASEEPALDRLVSDVVDLGYRLGQWRATVRRWLDEDDPSRRLPPPAP